MHIHTVCDRYVCTMYIQDRVIKLTTTTTTSYFLNSPSNRSKLINPNGVVWETFTLPLIDWQLYKLEKRCNNDTQIKLVDITIQYYKTWHIPFYLEYVAFCSFVLVNFLQYSEISLNFLIFFSIFAAVVVSQNTIEGSKGPGKYYSFTYA